MGIFYFVCFYLLCFAFLFFALLSIVLHIACIDLHCTCIYFLCMCIYFLCMCIYFLCICIYFLYICIYFLYICIYFLCMSSFLHRIFINLYGLNIVFLYIQLLENTQFILIPNFTNLYFLIPSLYFSNLTPFISIKLTI